MNLKNFLDEALVKGENMKDEITSDILNSKVVTELFKSDLFEKAVSKVVQTKDEVTKIIRDNVKMVLKVMDIPLRHDLISLDRKLAQLEKSVDKIGKRAIMVKSLKKIRTKKSQTSSPRKMSRTISKQTTNKSRY